MPGPARRRGARPRPRRPPHAVLGGLEARPAPTASTPATSPFVTIDPPGSRDLDQALHLERRPGGGFRVRYAIADVAAFVDAGRRRSTPRCGARASPTTCPTPARRCTPPVLGEGAASLLPGRGPPGRCCGRSTSTAMAWPVTCALERAVVRSRAQLTYAGVQAAVDAGRAEGTEALLAEVGPAAPGDRGERGRREPRPADPAGRARRAAATGSSTRPSCRPMGWNAQISLLTGMAAARDDARRRASGCCARCRRPPRGRRARCGARPRRSASPGRRAPTTPPSSAALDGDVPGRGGAPGAGGPWPAGRRATWPWCPARRRPPTAPPSEHAAVAAPYAHVTAPLRRLADRYAIEVCLALLAGQRRRRRGRRRRSTSSPRPWPGPRAARATSPGPPSTSSRRCCSRPHVGRGARRHRGRRSARSARRSCSPTWRCRPTSPGARCRSGEPVRVRVEAADPVAAHGASSSPA